MGYGVVRSSASFRVKTRVSANGNGSTGCGRLPGAGGTCAASAVGGAGEAAGCWARVVAEPAIAAAKSRLVNLDSFFIWILHALILARLAQACQTTRPDATQVSRRRRGNTDRATKIRRGTRSR